MAKAPAKGPKRRNRPGRPPTAEGTDRREDLLESAIRLFAGRGFNQVDLREISDDAGVTVGLIRHYFGAKESLIDEASSRVVARLQRAYQQMIADIDAESSEAFIDALQQRTYDILLPEYDLLRFLKHMSIELPEKSFPVFRTYFGLIQAELVSLETVGKIDPLVNKAWLAFMLMFMQLGPVFLARQIEDIVGRSAIDPEAARQRNASNARILKYGLVPREPPSDATG